MALRLPTATRDAMADPFAARLDGGSLEIRSGSQPASANDAATGTLLATITLPSPAATSDAGVVTLDVDPVPETTAAAGGTAGWGRLLDSLGATVVDGSVGTSGADFTINTTTIEAGGAVRLTGGTFTVPSGE